MNIEIHKLLSSDNNNFNKVLHLFRDVFGEEHQHIPPEGEQKKLLESPYFHVFVAKNGDRIVGGLTLYTFDYYTHLKKFGYIFDLAVAQDMQRQGIGSQLVKTVIESFKKQGYDEIFVQADKVDEYALKFYRKLGGFEEDVSHFYFSL